MGTVHGVYLKYVAIAAASYGGYCLLDTDSSTTDASHGRMMSEEATQSTLAMISRMIMAYSALLNGLISILFKMEVGMGIIGKDRTSGQIPLWSYIILFPFHIPTILYTRVHALVARTTVMDAKTGKSHFQHVPAATEVQPGWWVGGCYAHELGPRDWGGIIDLTVEFPESCWKRTNHYLSAPTWDGVPLSPADLDAAATFAVNARKEGDVIIHCAHGRGRSTTVMCAALVKAGLFSNWEEAFEKGIKPYRTVCKLNKRMRENLTSFQEEFVDTKKAL